MNVDQSIGKRPPMASFEAGFLPQLKRSAGAVANRFSDRTSNSRLRQPFSLGDEKRKRKELRLCREKHDHDGMEVDSNDGYCSSIVMNGSGNTQGSDHCCDSRRPPNKESDSSTRVMVPVAGVEANSPRPASCARISSIPQARRRRLLRDFQRLQTDQPPGISACPVDNKNLLIWQALIFGPNDTAWEGGTFEMRVEFPADYPYAAPRVYFQSTIFHPNVYWGDGLVCLDILQTKWSPAYDVMAILTSVQSLLCDPDTTAPVNLEAGRLYHNNRREYNRRVQQVVQESWNKDFFVEEQEEEIARQLKRIRI